MSYAGERIDRQAAAERIRARLREQVRAMTEDELVTALYCDPVTGLLNRRAFERGMSPVVAIVDLDGLKWVNDTRGHAAGDALLRDAAEALRAEFGEAHVYRLGGDEFAVRGRSLPELTMALHRVRERFGALSFGVGRDLADADASLRFEKAARERHGLRAARGERPREEIEHDRAQAV